MPYFLQLHPPPKQQPAASQIPTQTQFRWNINIARTPSKGGMCSLESFRNFYCKNTCVLGADGSNYGRKTLPYPQDQIPIVWAQANDYSRGQGKSDHSELCRLTSYCIRSSSALLNAHQNSRFLPTSFLLGKGCDLKFTHLKLTCFPVVSFTNLIWHQLPHRVTCRKYDYDC